MKIIEKTNSLQEMKKLFSALSKLKVEVGFFGGEKNNKDELTLATVAKINEYGSLNGKIPARPFMRMTLSRHNQFRGELKSALKKSVYDISNLSESFTQFGINAMQEIQREFTIGEFIENSFFTIKKKKSSRPLMNMGQLRRSVSWRLKR